jgi:outer membrane protein OmpA-like peptidoglycan-associated protein
MTNESSDSDFDGREFDGRDLDGLSAADAGWVTPEQFVANDENGAEPRLGESISAQIDSETADAPNPMRGVPDGRESSPDDMTNAFAEFARKHGATPNIADAPGLDAPGLDAPGLDVRPAYDDVTDAPPDDQANLIPSIGEAHGDEEMDPHELDGFDEDEALADVSSADPSVNRSSLQGLVPSSSSSPEVEDVRPGASAHDPAAAVEEPTPNEKAPSVLAASYSNAVAPDHRLPGWPKHKTKIVSVLAVGGLLSFVLQLAGSKPRMEKTLKQRVEKVFTLNGDNIKVLVNGRTVSLSGYSASEQARKKAIALAGSRIGVADVDASKLLLDKEKAGVPLPTLAPNSPVNPDGTGADPSGPSTTLVNLQAIERSKPMKKAKIEAQVLNGTLAIQGDVPDEIVRDLLLQRSTAAVGEDGVKSSLNVPISSPERADSNDYRRLGQLLGIITSTPGANVKISYDRGTMSIGGTVPNAVDLQTIRGEAANLVPDVTLITDTLAQGVAPASETTIPSGATVSGPVAVAIGDTNTPAAKAAASAVTTVISGRTISFQNNKALLTTEGRNIVDEVAKAILGQTDPKLNYEIAGFTDSIGSDADNKSLSQRRADAIVEALVARGIAKEKLVATGYGEASPIADNGTDSGRSKNRRIEVRVGTTR